MGKKKSHTLQVSSEQLRKFKPGPIRHKRLPEELMKQIACTYHQVGRFVCQTLEAWEIGFMREARPDREVAIWCRIAGAWDLYHQRYLDGKQLTSNEELALVAVLISISSGVDVTSTDTELRGVPKERASRLLECWRAVPGPDASPLVIG